MRLRLAAILLAAPVWAQNQTMNLTLAEAERLAIQNNPQFAAARLNAAAAYQVPLEYRASLAPSFAGSLTGVGAVSMTTSTGPRLWCWRPSSMYQDC